MEVAAEGGQTEPGPERRLCFEPGLERVPGGRALADARALRAGALHPIVRRMAYANNAPRERSIGL